MTTKRLWVIGGLIGAAAIAVPTLALAGPYPPGQQLQLDGRWDGSKIQVKVSNAEAGCTYSLKSRGFTGTTTAAGTDGIAYGSIDVGGKTGNYPVLAKSNCKGGDKTAQTKVTVTAFTVTAPASVKAGDNFTVSAKGWSPDSPITCALTGGGKTITSKPVTPNEDGDADCKFTAPTTPGSHAVTVVQGNASQSATVAVTKK